ncbi:MAG: M4 family metallopeptidase [Flavobacteriales bacterium]
MKKNQRIFILCIFLFGTFLNGFSQEKNQKPIQKFITFSTDENKSLSNESQLFEEQLKLPEGNSLTLFSETTDEYGFVQRKFKQLYQNIPVEFASTTINAKEGLIVAMSNNVFRISDLLTTPSINQTNALQSAINHVGASTYLWENKEEALLADHYKKPEGELVIIPTISHITETYKLAYKFDIYATNPVYRADVYIDAHSGAFIMENKKIHHANVPANGASLYNGTVSFTADNSSGPYRLRQTADGDGVETYDMNNGTNYGSATDITSGSTTFNHPTGVQAHFGAEQTHQYYLSTHSRNSFDNSGSVIRSYVSYSSNYVNAFWDGSRMTYGDGDGVNYNPLVSLDICGHEITHGVTQYSANLVYSYESGALNESFSDIFGESIENYTLGSNDWLMGDDIGIGGSGAFRSMSNPNTFGDPDTYLGTNWYTGSGDNGGVHINSGVQNFWYYLLTVGGSGTNDNGDAYSVSGIGIIKASNIAYRNLTVYLNSNSQYADARTGAIQAAIDLYGAGSAEEIATTNAWHAVGVGGPYGAPGSYCNSASTNVNDEYISRVQLNTIDNTSGGQFYSDFTATSTNLTEGDTYTITVTPTWTGTVYAEGYSVWIDYNDDQDFSDAGEQVWTQAATTNTPVSGTFTVPSGTAAKDVRMRVSMKYNGIPTSCETFTYGEVEDYTVNLSGGSTGPTVLSESYFETGWDGWVDGGSDATLYTKGSRAYEGNNAIRLRDNTTSSTMTLGDFDITSFNSIEIDFYYYSKGMKTGHSFLVEMWDGTSWNIAGTFTKPADFGNNNFYNGVVTINSSDFTFSNAAQFRFRCNADENRNRIYIDQVIITADPVTAISQYVSTQVNPPYNYKGDYQEDENFDGDLLIYPNPVASTLNIKMIDTEENLTFRIINLLGQTVMRGQINNQTINVNNLNNGIYFLEINDGDELMIKRFIKK